VSGTEKDGEANDSVDADDANFHGAAVGDAHYRRGDSVLEKVRVAGVAIEQDELLGEVQRCQMRSQTIELALWEGS
jgi:hypothetical protein